MYGTQVPGSVAAGVPGAITPFALGWDHALWLTLLAVTLVALLAAGLRLVPRRGA